MITEREPPHGGGTLQGADARSTLGGADSYRSLVLLPPDQRPYGEVLRTVLDLGAAGVIARCLEGGDRTPDNEAWINGNTESGHWEITATDRQYFGFVVSPAVGRRLESAARAGVGALVVKLESDGHCLKADSALTAVVRDGKKQELWLIASL